MNRSRAGARGGGGGKKCEVKVNYGSRRDDARGKILVVIFYFEATSDAIEDTPALLFKRSSDN